MTKRRANWSQLENNYGNRPVTPYSDESRKEALEGILDALQNKDVPNAQSLVYDGSALRFRSFTLSKTSLTVNGDLYDQDVEDLGRVLASMDSAVQFWIGDWANLYIEDTSNQFEMAQVYDRLADTFGMNKKTLQDYAYICRKIDASGRHEALNFSHHSLAARMVKDEQKLAEILTIAAANNLSVRELRTYIKTGFLPGNAPVEIAQPKRSSKPPSYTIISNLLTKARRGDDRAKKRLRVELADLRRWIETIESEI